MSPCIRRLMVTWIVGLMLGTSLIAITSPWFVRSYIPLRADSVRGVWTLPPDHTYRWRSEGYAESAIGPLGMPGKTSIGRRNDTVTRVALWGDSQAEGVCVQDAEKIFAQADRLGRGTLEVFPLARSGEDVADWLTQMPSVEKELGIDVHVLLIVDLPDLLNTASVPVPAPTAADIQQANAAIAAKLPAFVIQAARHVLTEADGSTPRSLRFTLGPVKKSASNQPTDVTRRPPDVSDRAKPMASRQRWQAAMIDLRSTTQRPIVLLYAPKIPQIVGGKVARFDRAASDFAEIQLAAERHGVQVIDVREQLRESADMGNWAHGFHNGQIGSGHLNAVGNRIVAAGLLDATRAAIKQRK